MPKILRMPTEEDLPKGPRRDFVEELFTYYRAARRPDLRTITDTVAALDEKTAPGTASRETIRQMLNGQTVPMQWGTAAVVFMALCELADEDYDAPTGYATTHGGAAATLLDTFEELWSRACDTHRPKTAKERAEHTANLGKILAHKAGANRAKQL